jgi:hypothetical protein
MVNLSIKEVLMNCDGLTAEGADSAIDECKKDFNECLENGGMPYDILEEYFGLEADYIMELMQSKLWKCI